MCFKSVNCTGEIIEKEDNANSYFSAKECCVGTENGKSFLSGGKCMVDECKGNIPHSAAV